MGLSETIEPLNDEDQTHKKLTITLHSFSDLTYMSPVVFLYLLKECYVHGSCKATKKFRALQHQVHQVLHNGPQPGPATFIANCLYVLPTFGLFCEGFSHLIISALRRYLKASSFQADCSRAKNIAAKLVIDIVSGRFSDHDHGIIVKIVQVFDVQLTNIDNVMHKTKEKNGCCFDTAEAFVEHYIFALIESQSFVTAVDLLEHFSIRKSGESFLVSMIENRQIRAAEKWAAFMGKPMLCLFVHELMDRDMLRSAYRTIKENNLREEFHDIYQKCKESSLKKLAEKGCWDVAEEKTNCDRQLLEYLVYLAMEAGYFEKVEELSDRHNLSGFLNVKATGVNPMQSHYLNLNELVVEDVIWVDEVDSLRNATCQIERCKVVGVDCEWKPNYEKGSKPNKVSIMQIASENVVFILDLIKLFKEAPAILDECLTRIFQSPGILKLGYNFQCDTKQLAHSYEELACFKHYEMLLDIQNVFKEHRGGLSGLAKKVLGSALNKTRRNSNWEQRPLTPNQLEYAALDAAVLVRIFHHVRDHCQPAGVMEGNERIEWKSYIIARMDNTKRSKKEVKVKQKAEKGTMQTKLNSV